MERVGRRHGRRVGIATWAECLSGRAQRELPRYKAAVVPGTPVVPRPRDVGGCPPLNVLGTYAELLRPQLVNLLLSALKLGRCPTPSLLPSQRCLLCRATRALHSVCPLDWHGSFCIARYARVDRR